MLVVRTRRPFFASRPGRALSGSTIAVGAATLLLPYTGLGPVLGFRPLPAGFLGALALILGAYIATAEFAKRLFYRAGPAP